MSNNFFSFKQFTIQQERCAQKVSTDACLLGALMAERWKNKKAILDIGAGTGLLMLMLAQRSGARIHGIEIEKDCFEQLQQNITASIWNDRLTPIYGDAVDYEFTHPFDGIISNPPFFENDLPPADPKSQIARHSVLLTLKQLFGVAQKWLKADGEFALLVPEGRIPYCQQTAMEGGLYLSSCIHIRHSPGHPYHRGVMIFQQVPTGPSTERELTLMEKEQQYTTEALHLLKDYYLYL